MKITWSPAALGNLRDIHEFLAKRNRQAAGRVVDRIEELVNKLALHPGMGRATDLGDIRILPVVTYPYVIFYTVLDEQDELRILRVRHGMRRPLEKDELD